MIKAFTLLESLVALIVVSGSLLVYQGLTKNMIRHSHYLANNDQDNWLLFSQQLREELSEARFYKVEKNKLYIEKGKKILVFGQFKSHDFRKTASNGQGYQPMLFGLSSSQIKADQSQISISLTWKSGLERTFYYAFQN
ncbi:competence type IV pilus minor pilin ComGF [Streptococcus castoreus]|uniref:competence type IV pilus minor pilin ComGF n=1 Tax=Streptococcus castoreus TaxID=254786 RepID=UPI0004087728|nr:competence type IV pilus minor pilin ComGF [Streptococcus castoreus]